MSEQKERTVSFGFWTLIAFAVLATPLWGIAHALRSIDYHIVVANCLHTAEHGLLCPEAQKDGKQ